MKFTKTQLKQIIKEELDAASQQYTVGQIGELMQDAFADGEVIVQLDGVGEPLRIFEAYESGGNIYLSVERK